MRQLRVPVRPDEAELVADRCWQLGAHGVWDRSDDAEPHLVVGALPSAAPGILALHPRAADVTDEEAVTLATARVEFAVAGEHLVVEVPPTVFGDGRHPTTRACLARLETLVTPGCRVVDVGCGSGILSVAAARLGAEVRAVDVDAAAVGATLANAARHGLAVVADTTPVAGLAGMGDVVVANVSAATIVELADDLARLTAPDGHLVVSGILDDRWEGVGHRLAGAGFALVEQASDQGWTTATMRR